jgi:hypothetical protein
MIKMLLTVAVAVLGSVGSLAGLAMAQGKQGQAFGSDVSSLLAKLETQCLHRRRTMPPDPRDDCANKLNKLRSDAQIGSGQDGAPVSSSQASRAGPGNGGNQDNGTGPGSGGGNGRGRR